MVLLLWIVIGAMTGWVMGEWMPKNEFGMAGHIMIGIIGALLGGYFFTLLYIYAVGSLITALIGAVGLVLAGRVAGFDSP